MLSMSIAGALGTVLIPIPPAAGWPSEEVVRFAAWELALAWTMATLLGLAGIGVLALIDLRRDDARAARRRRHVPALRPRLPAGWNTDPDARVTRPLRSGAGGSIDRVPPRSAAGSSPLRLVRRT